MTTLFVVLVVLAVARGILHYGEQYCNHFIAFKLLAMIRHKVFTVLRKLCPAKLEGRDKGNLISVITSDIELLEVFYAHTISPVAIAVATCLVMVLFIGQFSPAAAVLALAGYVTVGGVLPLVFDRRGGEAGMEFRNAFGDLNSFILDSLRGLDETIQYGQGEKRRQEMKDRSDSLGRMQKKLNRVEAAQKSVTNLVILVFFCHAVSYDLSETGRRGRSFGNGPCNRGHDGIIRTCDSSCKPAQQSEPDIGCRRAGSLHS